MPECNGWKNYETWLVNIWMDNDQGLADAWRERAEELCHNDHPVGDLADEMQEFYTELAAAEMPDSGMFTDLLKAALREVSWHDIARSYIDDVEPV